MNIEIRYNRVIDFFLAFIRVTSYEEFNKYDFDSRYVLSEEIQNYVSETRNKISPSLIRDMDYIYRYFSRGFYYIMYNSVMKGIESVEDLITYYKELSTDEFLEIIYDALDIDGLREMDEDQKKEAIEILFKEQPLGEIKEEPIIYLHFLTYPDDIRSLMLNAIQSFYSDFVECNEEQVEVFISDKLYKHRELVKKDPELFIENILMMVAKEDLIDKNIAMYITYYGEVSCSFSIDNNQISVLYGYSLEQRFDKTLRRKEYQNIIKTLSDEKRYHIIELLGKRQWYGKELADQLGITTATLSYHIKKIALLGIINIETGKRKRIYYSLNKEKFKNALADMVSDIINE